MIRRIRRIVAIAKTLAATVALLNDPPLTPEPPYEPVATPDAIAILAMPTGHPDVDMLHGALIDLVQNGFVNTVRDDIGQLRFAVTELGELKVREIQGFYGERPLPVGDGGGVRRRTPGFVLRGQREFQREENEGGVEDMRGLQRFPSVFGVGVGDGGSACDPRRDDAAAAAAAPSSDEMKTIRPPAEGPVRFPQEFSRAMERAKNRCSDLSNSERILGYMDSYQVYRDIAEEFKGLSAWLFQEITRANSSGSRLGSYVA